jgi:hypothetical protein
LDVTVDVQLWIDGKDEAAHDYAASTTQAVRRMIAKGASSEPRLHVAIRDIHEHETP